MEKAEKKEKQEEDQIEEKQTDKQIKQLKKTTEELAEEISTVAPSEVSKDIIEKANNLEGHELADPDGDG